MATGKCPKCEGTVTRVVIEDVDISGGPGMKTWRGLNYLCPHCRTVLSTGMDPLALKADTVAEIRKLLGH